MSRNKKSKKPGKEEGEKVVPIGGPANSQAGGPASGPSQDGQPSRPLTIDEAGIELAQEVITQAIASAKEEEVVVKLLTAIIERECINQRLQERVLMEVAQTMVHAQRAESMSTFIMRRQGAPVRVPGEKGQKGTLQFKTWFEEWRTMWERYEQQQQAAAEGAAQNGQANSNEPGPEAPGPKSS